MAAGGVAGGTVEAALFPIDTIKTRLQAARSGTRLDLTGLYTGVVPNVLGAMPASALFFAVYEPAKQALLKALPEVCPQSGGGRGFSGQGGTVSEPTLTNGNHLPNTRFPPLSSRAGRQRRT